MLIDVEHRCGRTVLRCHIGNGCPVTDGQTGRTFTEEFHISTHHALFTQELGQCQHDIGGGNARLAFALQLNTNNIRQTHHGWQAKHHGFGFQTTHTNRNNTQRIDVRGVGVGADTGIRIGYTIARLNHRRHFLQVDLVHDAVTCRNHIHVVECGLGPVNKVETVFVTALFDLAVFGEGIRIKTAAFNRQRVVNDQLSLHHRIDFGRITALFSDGITQTSQIDQSGLTENVVTYHTRRIPRKIQITLTLDQLRQGIGQQFRLTAAHQLFGQNTGGIWQAVIAARFNSIDRGTGIKVLQCGAGQWFTEFGVHGVFSQKSRTARRQFIPGPVDTN